MKAFESIGMWFLPDDRDTQVGGTMSFSKEDGITLSLSGSFKKDWDITGADYPLIHGVVSESPYGNFISLFGCFATNLRVGMPGISIETIRANQGYAGSDFVDSEAMLFGKASLQFSGLGAWLNYSGLRVEPKQDRVDISWRRPQQLHAQVAGATISTGFGWSTKGGPFERSISLDETPAFIVKEFGGATANEIHSRFAGPLSTLMTFASDSPSNLDRYQLFKTEGEPGLSPHFDRLYVPAVKLVRAKSKTRHDLLFTLDDVVDRFEPFMQGWLDFVKTHPDFCTMFFSYGYETQGFLETRFLFLMQAAECLLQDETSADSNDLRPFESLRQSLHTSNSLAKQPYGHFALPSAIQMAMPTLFYKLVHNHWNLIQSIVGTTEERFLNVLFATFDYVTHRGTRGPDVVSGSNILWLHQRLAAVLKICVLKRLGFTDAKIGEIVERNAEMSHLKTIKEPWESLSEED